MSDIIDDANNQAEMALQQSLRARRPAGPEATGQCLFCADPLQPPKRWCSADCRDMFEHQQRRGARV